jgi:hypothetical protein
MVAALLLERLSIPRSKVAHASVMRGINDGPLKLVILVLSRNTLHLFRHLEAWLIVSVAFLGLALQFTSTILLSDMHSFDMIGDPNVTTFNSIFAYPGKGKGHLALQTLMQSAPVYPLFGEVSGTQDSGPDNHGLSDTGLTQRGLLPMMNRDFRTSVRDYDGMGMVMSSRVACMRPIMTNMSLDISTSSDKYRQLQGVLHYNQSLQEARPGTGKLCSASQECEQTPFDCEIPELLGQTGASYRHGWATGGCVVNGVGGSFRGADQPTWDPTSGPWSENSSIWLVYSSSITEEKWKWISPNPSMNSADPPGDTEWLTYEVGPGQFIKITVCFSDFDFAYRSIHMRAAGATTERLLNHSFIIDQNLAIEELKTYLGLDHSRQSVADRGILAMEVTPGNGTVDDAPYVPPPPFNDILKQPADQITPAALTASCLNRETSWGLNNADTANSTFMLCSSCSIAATPLHGDYAALFSSIIIGNGTGSGRAADALHAFMSVAGLNVYDQFLAGSMNVAEKVRVVTTLKVTAPGSWPPSRAACAGLIAVASLLATYFCLVMATTVLYTRHTRYSRYGNIWHVISQLGASEELEETLELGNDAGDEAVVKGLRIKESNEDVLVKLGRIDGCEKIVVTKLAT